MKRFATGYRPGMDLRTGVGPRAAVALAVALTAGLLAGCGSDDDLIGSANASTLHAQVATVRKAVADGRDPAALAAVAELRSTIRRLASLGELDPADTVVLLAQVDRIEGRIEARATPTPTPTPTAAADVEPKDQKPGPAADEKPGKKPGKDKKKGKGNG